MCVILCLGYEEVLVVNMNDDDLKFYRLIILIIIVAIILYFVTKVMWWFCLILLYKNDRIYLEMSDIYESNKIKKNR